MSVSINVQFTGQTDGPKHRAVISEIKGAIEGVLAANGNTVIVSATEQEVTTKSAGFPSGDVANGSTWTNGSVILTTGFHMNEDPVASVVAPVSAPAETTPATSDTSSEGEGSSASAPTEAPATDQSNVATTPSA